MIEGIELEDFSRKKVSSSENIVKRDASIYGHIKVCTQVVLGGAEISVDELLSLKLGSVIKMLESVHEPMKLLVDGKIIAMGTLVVVDENFGFEITEILD